jgi:hypothetical protein
MRLALLALAACGSAAAPEVPHNTVPIVPEACAPLPADWRPAEMAAAAIGGAATAGDDVRVLAWQQTIDDRPLRIDSALLWIKSAGSGYWLAHVYRHPDDGPKASWNQAMIYDAPDFRGEESFAKAPTHAQLDEFAQHSDFQFGPEQDFLLVAYGQCSDAWMKSFGERPWHVYPPIEKTAKKK